MRFLIVNEIFFWLEIMMILLIIFHLGICLSWINWLILLEIYLISKEISIFCNNVIQNSLLIQHHKNYHSKTYFQVFVSILYHSKTIFQVFASVLTRIEVFLKGKCIALLKNYFIIILFNFVNLNLSKIVCGGDCFYLLGITQLHLS